MTIATGSQKLVPQYNRSFSVASPSILKKVSIWVHIPVLLVMRFRFCGDLDCPDWILAEINTVARMTSIKMKLLCQEVAKHLLSGDIDYEKVKKLTADARFESGDMKATLAALTFIMTSSAQHGVDDETLGSELQQLGLPREHSLALCRVYSEHLRAITSHLHSSSLRLSVLKNVQCNVNVVMGSSVHAPQNGRHHVEAQLQIDLFDTINDKDMNHRFNITADQMAILISALKEAQKMMDAL